MNFCEYRVSSIQNFELKDIFECGQCFRWKKEENGSYTGVTKVGVINVSNESRDVIIKGYVESTNFEAFCRNYFDLDRNYREIQKEISKNDEVMKQAIKYGNGIRILNQDPWEMLVSFIISAANNIPRISRTIENISAKYGQKIHLSEEEAKKITGSCQKLAYYMFPSAQELKKSTMDELRECNLGFRDKYVYNAMELVNNKTIDLNEISSMEYAKAKKELVKVPGVGSKVADCILLFSMGKTEAFPVDTWIKQIMNEVYIESKSAKKINEFALQKFGEYAGIAQQYLFYYKREGNI